jgi:hypothetical protein
MCCETCDFSDTVWLGLSVMLSVQPMPEPFSLILCVVHDVSSLTCVCDRTDGGAQGSILFCLFSVYLFLHLAWKTNLLDKIELL